MTFSVTFLPRGLTLTVNPNETIMQAAQRQDFILARACDAGTCQLCEATLVEGRVSIKNRKEVICANKNTPAKIYPCIAIPQQSIHLEVRNVLSPGELPIKEIHAQIKSVQQVSPDVKRVTLRLPAGKKLLFHPGQYLEILLADGMEAAYSIATAPNQDRTLELHIRANLESESYLQLEPLLLEGSILPIRLPKGTVTLHKLTSAPQIVFVAASTGYSQVQSMLQGLLENQDSRSVHVYWGARHPEDLYLHQRATELAQSHNQVSYTAVVSDEPDYWPGRTGLVHNVVLEDLQLFEQAMFVLCGSPAMVYAAYDDFIKKGIQPEQIISDVFDYAPRPAS